MVDPVNLRLALISTAILGFRHGLDYDHIAAITDISSVQSKARDAMKYGLLYVSGHATTVALLGAAAIVFRIALPPASDRWAERLVGITLLVLGVYVLGTFFRPSAHSHGVQGRESLWFSTELCGSIGDLAGYLAARGLRHRKYLRMGTAAVLASWWE